MMNDLNRIKDDGIYHIKSDYDFKNMTVDELNKLVGKCNNNIELRYLVYSFMKAHKGQGTLVLKDNSTKDKYIKRGLGVTFDRYIDDGHYYYAAIQAGKREVACIRSILDFDKFNQYVSNHNYKFIGNLGGYKRTFECFGTIDYAFWYYCANQHTMDTCYDHVIEYEY